MGTDPGDVEAIKVVIAGHSDKKVVDVADKMEENDKTVLFKVKNKDCDDNTNEFDLNMVEDKST